MANERNIVPQEDLIVSLCVVLLLSVDEAVTFEDSCAVLIADHMQG